MSYLQRGHLEMAPPFTVLPKDTLGFYTVPTEN